MTTDSQLFELMQTEPELMNCCCVILDEAHERTINTDILLCMLKTLAKRRGAENFKFIVTSATIDYEKFLNYFKEGAAYLHVPGKVYPVETIYCPIEVAGGSASSNSNSVIVSADEFVNRISELVRELMILKKSSNVDEKYRGHILVFLPNLKLIENVF